MKKNTQLTIALFAAIIFISSCGKNYCNCNIADPTGNIISASDPSGLSTLFNDLHPEPQVFNVSAGTSSDLKGAEGTVLHFYPNSFKDADGNIIKSGTINITLTEMYKPGSMIANRATTMSGGKVLNSGGQINITASMNGQNVSANTYRIEFLQTAASGDQMNLFTGSNNNVFSLTTWINAGDTANCGTIAFGTSTGGGGGSYYVFDSCRNFGWTNCDRFYDNDSPKTSVGVVMPDSSFNPNNTQIFLVLPDIKGVMSNVEPGLGGAMYSSTTNTIRILSEGLSDIVPVGMNYKIVVITKKNNNYFYYQTSGVVTRNLKPTAVMEPKTSDQVKSLLNSL